MSIGSVGASGSSGADGNNQQYLQFLKQEYKTVFTNFTDDPSVANATALRNFLESNQSNLTILASQVGYQPSPGEQFSADFNGAILALNHFISSGGQGSVAPACEFANDVRQWIGVEVDPQDVQQTVNAIMEAFLSNPSPHTAESLEWMLNTPGYREALSVFAEFNTAKGQFSKNISSVQMLLNQYINNPNDSNVLTALDSAIKTLANNIR
jgi:hypothetical protein